MRDKAGVLTGPNDTDVIDVDIDALPYVERDLEQGMRDKVNRMIEKEMRRMKRVDRSTLPKEVELFKDNDFLAQELARVAKKTPLDALDISRYELKGPDEDTVEGWKKAVDNTKAQLESQAGSVFNLELLQKYGGNAWRVHNFQVEAMVKQLQEHAEVYRRETLATNRQRKLEQTDAKKTLDALDAKWSDLIGRNLQVGIACATVEAEIDEIRRYVQENKK